MAWSRITAEILCNSNKINYTTICIIFLLSETKVMMVIIIIIIIIIN